jgi:hypothetical protein
MLQQVVDTDIIGLYINFDESVKVRSEKSDKYSKMDVQIEKTNWES